MKKLCLGTFLHILSQAKGAVTQKGLISYVLSFFGKATDYGSTSDIAHYKSGRNNLTGYEDLRTHDKAELVAYYDEEIIPLLDQSLKRHVVLAIKDVLSEDDVPSLTTIGYESGYTKQDIIGKYHFNLAELLANIFYYCVIVVGDQHPFQQNIREIPENYVASFAGRIHEVELDETVEPVFSAVAPTIQHGSFDGAFREIAGGELNLPNSNLVKLFSLDIANGAIDYGEIKRFIRRNIGRYVFSRARRSNYEIAGDIESVSSYAIDAYRRKLRRDPETNHFNEIMLYSFLEGALGAPKLFSKMELQNRSGEYETLSSGIHILFLRRGDVPFNQVVLGASDTEESLTSAIDRAFDQIAKIASGVGEDYELVESSVYDREFDNETNAALEGIIVPKKGVTFNKPEKAFGLFVGYSLETADKPRGNDEFIAFAQEKMEADIKAAIPYIEGKVAALGLENHSFYVYFLPLNEALKDKESIIRDALFPEGGD